MRVRGKYPLMLKRIARAIRRSPPRPPRPEYITLYDIGEEYPAVDMGQRYDQVDPDHVDGDPVFCTPMPDSVDEGRETYYAQALAMRYEREGLAKADLEGAVLHE